MEKLLAKLKEVTPKFSVEDCNRVFPEIAKMLLEDYAIKSGDKTYRITEIEFYYYAPKINDDRTDTKKEHVTYERTTPAGYWFFHDWGGIDLTFESNKEKIFGGGILIRGIKQVEPTVGKAVDGPYNSYLELFDKSTDAFKETASNPHIINYKYEVLPEIEHKLRKGLEEKDKNQRKWRFNIDVKKL